MTDFEFAGAQAEDMKLTVSYALFCHGGKGSSLGIKDLDSGAVNFFTFGEEGQITLVGKGPFVAFDNRPIFTEFACGKRIASFLRRQSA